MLQRFIKWFMASNICFNCCWMNLALCNTKKFCEKLKNLSRFNIFVESLTYSKIYIHPVIYIHVPDVARLTSLN